MLRRLLLLLVVATGVFAAQGAFAGRILPRDVRIGEIGGVHYPDVRIGDNVYRLSPGSVIFDRSNRTILPTFLPQVAKIYYLVNSQGQLAKIWIMTPGEEARLQ